jgi:hypothetical protein
MKGKGKFKRKKEERRDKGKIYVKGINKIQKGNK